MATDLVTIWNQALSAAGGRGTVSSLDERSREADLCRLWYPTVRDMVLKAASWPSANKSVRLALLAERADGSEWAIGMPEPSYRFAYALPADMLAPRHLASFGRFTRHLVGATPALMCNEAGAILKYTFRQEEVTLWDAGLEAAMIYTLAATIALPLSGKGALSDRLFERANELTLLARTEFANESDEFFETPASWIAARGFTTPPVSTKFVYPYEDLYIIGA